MLINTFFWHHQAVCDVMTTNRRGKEKKTIANYRRTTIHFLIVDIIFFPLFTGIISPYMALNLGYKWKKIEVLFAEKRKLLNENFQLFHGFFFLPSLSKKKNASLVEMSHSTLWCILITVQKNSKELFINQFFFEINL